jgi:hypothetical protein
MQDAIVRGFELTYNSPDDVYVEPGTLFHGYTPINKTARTNLLLAMPTHWWDNQVHSYSGGEGWCYIGVNSSGDIRFLADNPPNAADTQGNTEGTKIYWLDDSLSYWRIIGAIRVNEPNEVARKWFQQGNTIMWDVPVNITTTVSPGAWSTPLPCARGMPVISTMGIFGACAQKASDNAAHVVIRPNGSAWPAARENSICGGSTGGNAPRGVGGQRWCMTDISQDIQYWTLSDSDTFLLDVEGYVLDIR